MSERFEQHHQSGSHCHVPAGLVADLAGGDSDFFPHSADADGRDAPSDSSASQPRNADSWDDNDRGADTDRGAHGAADAHVDPDRYPQPHLEFPEPDTDLSDADVSSESHFDLPDPDADLPDADISSESHLDLSDSDALRIRIRAMKLSSPQLAASFALLLLSAAPEARASLPFVEDDYARALEQARARHVPIFLEAWAPW
jgi:hypothetical protein